MHHKKDVYIALTVGLVGLSGTANAATLANGSMFAPGSPISEEFDLGPTTPGKWGSPAFGTGAVVTWSLMASGIPTDDGLSAALSTFMPGGYKSEIESALAAWSAVADITFVEIPDGGEDWNAAGTSGDIRFGGHAFDGPGGTLAHGYYPPANGLTAAGDIHFDSTDIWKIGFGGAGFDIFQVAAHEVGHAIGLEHTGVPGSLMNPFYTESFSGLQPDDIAGGVFIYGPATVVEPPMPPNAVPEPSSLLGLGFLLSSGLLVRSRRSRS